MLRPGVQLNYIVFGNFYMRYKVRILFVCTGNICRSPMAEGYFRSLCEKSKRSDINVVSAGTYAGNTFPASSQAVRIMSDYGIDISKHKSQQITKELLNVSDLTVVMTRTHKERILAAFKPVSSKVFLLHEFDSGIKDVFDPFGGNHDIYNSCFSEMKKALDNLFLDIDKL